MNDKKIPDWLVETQNKSWEPEILISGITLTFVFLLSNHIYNFCGMLTQEFGVFDKISWMLFAVLTVLITGLKIILIIHLILRGVWTGFVGLSYVFPHGIRKENLPEEKKDFEFRNLDTFVIGLERICSLLYSFVFNSVVFVLGFFALIIPIAALAFTGLKPPMMRTITLVLCGIVMGAAILFALLMETKLKGSKLQKRMESSMFNITLVVYYTNIGRLKTNLIILSYFLIVIILSLDDIQSFSFENDLEVKVSHVSSIQEISRDHYEDRRETKKRIAKGVIDRFNVEGNSLDLFLSFYKEDFYTIEVLKMTPEYLKEFKIASKPENISLRDLYTITIDGMSVEEGNWYITEHSATGQTGLVPTLGIASLKEGYHELRVDKLFYNIDKKKMFTISAWDIIPFERAGGIQ